MFRKEILKGFVAGTIVTMLIIMSFVSVFAWGNGKNLEVFYGVVKKIVIDGIDKTSSEEKNLPFIYNGTTYVPLRYIAESLGKPVDWDESTGIIYIGNKFVDVYLYNQPVEAMSEKGIRADSDQKGFVFGDLSELAEGETIFITYNVYPQAEFLKFHESMKASEGWSSSYRILNESGRELFKSDTLTDRKAGSVTIPIKRAKQFTIEVKIDKKGRNSSDTCAELFISDLKILAKNY